MFIVAIHSNTLKWQQHRRRSTVLCCRCVNIVRPIYITFSKFVARLWFYSDLIEMHFCIQNCFCCSIGIIVIDNIFEKYCQIYSKFVFILAVNEQFGMFIMLNRGWKLENNMMRWLRTLNLHWKLCNGKVEIKLIKVD